jgi:hypothetical protein
MDNKINFLLLEMTYLRYFMPLVIEASKRGIKCRMFYGSSKKYNNPSAYLDVLSKLSADYNFELYPLREKLPSCPCEVTVTLEGRGHGLVDYKTKKVVLIATGDFAFVYDEYIADVQTVIFPSKFIAEYYGKTSPKNLYLGCPKYDVELNTLDILKKYELPATKKALILYPNLRPSICPKWHRFYPQSVSDHFKYNLEYIYDLLRTFDFKIVVKTRGKHAVQSLARRGDYFFKDHSWYPHSTMELIQACDLIINFDSAAIKECVMLGKPVINFPVRPEVDWYHVGGFSPRRDGRSFDFLYKYKYCEEPATNLFTLDTLSQSQKKAARDMMAETIDRLLLQDHSADFLQARQNHLFVNERNVSKNILDTIM